MNLLRFHHDENIFIKLSDNDGLKLFIYGETENVVGEGGEEEWKRENKDDISSVRRFNRNLWFSLNSRVNSKFHFKIKSEYLKIQLNNIKCSRISWAFDIIEIKIWIDKIKKIWLNSIKIIAFNIWFTRYQIY